MSLRAPFTYFGGKRTVAEQVWTALGDVDHYIEPFFGSGAVLLGRPHRERLETVNDLDALLANFWRAIKHDPDTVAQHADWPVNEVDLHARHLWLVGQRETIAARAMGDPDWFDAKAAGWWAWGACAWIGGGWCEGRGPWVVADGVMVDSRQLPHLSDTGVGINRKLPRLGDAGVGINRKLPRPGDAGVGDARARFIKEWFAELHVRLRDVRAACGDWTRVTGPAVLGACGGVTGIFFDPPYDLGERAAVYAVETAVGHAVLAWCKANGSADTVRIVLAGYDGEHDALSAFGWRTITWKAMGGYGNQGDGRGAANAHRERLWLSPQCLDVSAAQGSLL